MMSSTTTTRAPLTPAAHDALIASAPERLTARPAASRPAWSATSRTCVSAGASTNRRPRRRSRRTARRAIRANGSCPRARVLAARDGTGTTSTRPSRAGRATETAPGSTGWRAGESARARASPRDRASAKRRSSLCATSAERTVASYAATVHTGGSSGGHGSGAVRRGHRRSADPHGGHSATPRAPQPRHSAGTTRSSSAARSHRIRDTRRRAAST